MVPDEGKKSAGKRKFRFENAWLTDPMCKQLVVESWEISNNADIQSKIKHVSDNLFQWGQEITGKFNSRIKSCKVEMKKWRKVRDVVAVHKYNELKTSVRRRNNQISRLKDGEGRWIDWEGGLDLHITEYFSHLFNATQTEWREVVDCVESKIIVNQNAELLQHMTELEVRITVFQMDPNKAPGPDGVIPTFYQKHWSIVGQDVVFLVREFFKNCTLPEGLNETNIVLIPKKKSLVLQIGEADGSVKYLGLPNLVGRNKAGVLGFLKETMKTRVLSWK
ncbi:uncharacterized protein LOC141714417 [Apium graveolens]|uniref:uncharacterized protein LOC141714417 n=1 Tax=Apium graveolens TaxID=4045 RepID=UPI003D7AA4CD